MLLFYAVMLSDGIVLDCLELPVSCHAHYSIPSPKRRVRRVGSILKHKKGRKLRK